MESRGYNSLFQCSSRISKNIATETVTAYFEVYVVPNLKKLYEADDTINIPEILCSQMATNEKKFAEFIDNKYKHQGPEFKSVLMVLRRLFYGDLDVYDPLMASLINNDKALGIIKHSKCEYNIIIANVIRINVRCYFEAEISDVTSSKWMLGS